MKLPENLTSTPRRLAEIKKFVFKRDLATIPCYEIEVDGKAIRYTTSDNSSLLYGRVATIFAKEPTTIPYLETFGPDDVFLDVGANVGMYTIYAAVMTGCRVYCIEPEALNFAELNKNIYINGLHGRVLAFCAAASNEFSIGPLLLGAFAPGYSHHDFIENTWRKETQAWGKGVTVSRDNRISQGSISLSIDQMVEARVMPTPNHIKIDVDGLEPKIIDGAKRTLQSPHLKSVLVEIDFGIDAAQDIIETMVAMGWKYSLKQLVTNRAMIMREGRIQELRDIKKDGFNYIFFRDDAYGRLFEDFLARYEPPYEQVTGRLRHAPRLVDLMSPG